MRYSSRLFLYGPVVLLLLIAAAVMVWWKISATSFDARLSADNGREIMPGVRMSYASKEMEGFPFRVDSVMEGFTLQVQMRTGPLVWHAEHFAIHALTYGRNQQVFEAAGTQTLLWTDSEGVHRRWSFVPGSLRASAIIADGRLSRFDLDAVGINSPELFATRLQFHLRRDPARDALDFAVSGDDLRLAEQLRAGFGEKIAELNVGGSFSPAFPLLPLLAGQWDWRTVAESWRERHGSLEIQQLQIAWGRVHAAGLGKLSLNAGHFPDGYLALTVSGLVPSRAFGGDDGKPAFALDRLSLYGFPRDSEGRLRVSVNLRGGDVNLLNVENAGKLNSLY
jgi:hypothetical protein